MYDDDAGFLAVMTVFLVVVAAGASAIITCSARPGRQDVVDDYGNQYCKPLCKNEYRVDYKPGSKDVPLGCSCIDPVPAGPAEAK